MPRNGGLLYVFLLTAEDLQRYAPGKERNQNKITYTFFKFLRLVEECSYYSKVKWFTRVKSVDILTFPLS